jgi:PAS domain S-box-containing protein
MTDAGKDKLSQTMRIDLIPDSPSKPLPGRKKRYVIARTPKRESQEVVPAPAPAPPREAQSTRYQELLQSLYDAAVITDLSGQIVDANIRALEFLHYERNELIGLAISDIVSGADQSLVDMLTDNLKNERFTLIQAYCIRKDASIFPAEIATNTLNLGAPCLCFFVRDITLRRQAEEMLRTEHNAIQNAGNGIAIANSNGLLEYVNPAVARMWGYEKTEDLRGRDFRTLFADNRNAETILAATQGNHQYWSGEIKARRRDDSQFDIQVSAACNRDSEGEHVGAIFSFTDISDRKRADQAEREAERRRVMLESFGAACHHLGQPATVLLVNLGIISRKLEEHDDQSLKELLESSLESMKTLGEILRKLNTVNEYRTTKYLEGSAEDESDTTRIIEI